MISHRYAVAKESTKDKVRKKTWIINQSDYED